MKEIYMPKNGMDMTEGTLIRWLKQEGEHVDFGEPIIEIETDKVTMEAESPADGILLKKLFEDGAVVPVLTTIGYVGEPGEKLPEDEKAAVAEAPADAPAASVAAPVSGDAYQVAVIGGGPAGYVAAIRAAQLGAKTVIFEKDTVGGTCLNRGCIPTKTYLKTAEYLHNIRNAASKGIKVGEPTVDMPAVVANKNQVVKTLTSGIQGLLRSNGVEFVSGEAKLVAADTIACNGKQYVAGKIILCGGSKAIRIPIPGVEGENVMTSNEILDLQEVPEKLCIIGGGVIGCEMACAFSAFGSKVTIVEAMDRLVSVMDEEISKEITKGLKEQGVVIHTGAKVEAIKANAVVTDSGEIACDKVLLSIGRAADLGCLGDLAEQIKTERGKIVVDDTMRTSIPNIYACGDINGRSMLAHSASQMAEIAAENCVKGEDLKCDLRYVPSVLYTMPEAASVGLTEAKARELHPEGVLVGKFPFVANSRAVAYGEKQGFVKVIADKTYGEILGAHIVGGTASEMIAEPTALMVAEATIQDVAFRMIHGHPSFSEAFMEACKDALGAAVHIPAKKK